MPKLKRGSGSIYRKRGWWYAAYYAHGKQVTEATKTKDRKKARGFLNAKLGQIAEGTYTGPAVERTTFSDLVKLLETDYQVNGRKTLAAAQRRIRMHLKPVFGAMRARDIKTAHVQAFIGKRKGETHGKKKKKPTSNAEINRELGVLGRMFTLGVKAEVVLRKPTIEKLTENNVRTGFLSRPDFDVLLAALPDYLRPPLTFAYTTGWRVHSEVLPLTWDRVDLDEGTVRLEVGTTKNGEGRDIFVTSELLAVLETQWIDHQTTHPACALVFHENGRRIFSFYKAWRKACAAAGVGAKVPHDFRRSAVRNMVRAGIPERVAMTMSGHKTRSIFDRYHIVAPGDLREAAARLEGRTTTQTTTRSTLEEDSASEGPTTH